MNPDADVDHELLLRKLNEDRNFVYLQSVGANSLDPSQLFALFFSIILHTGGQMGIEEYEQGQSESMQEKLQVAWKDQSFGDVLRELYPLPACYSRECVEKAWNIPYEGSLHHLLFSNINEMKGMDPYENICAIIQSSGTGKSRMVDEQAKLVYTLPININVWPRKGIHVPFPPRDDPLCEYLVEEPRSLNLDQCKMHYFVFFKHLFSHASEALEQIPTHPGMSGALLATRWHQYMSNKGRRHNFYREVVEMCRAESTLVSSSAHHEATNRDDNNATNVVLHREATERLCNLVQKLDKHSAQPEIGAKQVKIVIYIDEAHGLYRSAGNGETQFYTLCSVLASFAAQPLFVLLLSTELLLPLPVAPHSGTSPFKYGQSEFLLHPITEIPFDCAPGAQVQSGQLRVDDLQKFDYLAQWGRPLWWTTFQASELSVEEKRDSIMELARMKLLGRHDIKCKLSDILSHSSTRVAIIDVLLALDFEPSCSSKLQNGMVKRHMRIAYSIPRHCEHLHSGYSSEPVLAEAAAQQIYHFKSKAGMKSSLDVMIQLLQEPLESTLVTVDLGQRGEVVMRLLLMQAYLDAVVAEQVSPLVFSRGCQLVTFISQLFSPSVSDAILVSRPDNEEDKREAFSSAFRNSVVRLTHFVKAMDQYAVTTEALFAAFARGMAFICHQTQRSLDIAIPVLYDKTKPLEESNMTTLLVQVAKRRLKGRAPWAHQFYQKDIGVFPTNAKPDRPYITLILELGAELKREAPIYVSPVKYTQFPSDDKHPRYHITAYGCSDVVYKAAGGLNDALKHLLATHDFLRDHPREGDSRSAVMKMKPAWMRGGDSFHWVSDQRLNPTNPNEPETDTEDTEMDVDEL